MQYHISTKSTLESKWNSKIHNKKLNPPVQRRTVHRIYIKFKLSRNSFPPTFVYLALCFLFPLFSPLSRSHYAASGHSFKANPRTLNFAPSLLSQKDGITVITRRRAYIARALSALWQEATMRPGLRKALARRTPQRIKRANLQTALIIMAA